MQSRHIKKKTFAESNRIAYTHHMIMFIIREIIFSILLIPVLNKTGQKSIKAFVASNILVLVGSNTFLLFITIDSLVNKKIFRYYIAILYLLDTGIIVILTTRASLRALQVSQSTLISVLIGVTYFIEALISIYLVYINRFLSWMEVFKKIGANQNVRNAYFYRQILKAVIPFDVFIMYEQILDICFPKEEGYTLIEYFNTGLIFITALALLFICVHLDEEDRKQRNIAIILTAIDLAVFLCIFAIIIVILSTNSTSTKIKVTLVYSINNIVLTTATLILLIKDKSMFGLLKPVLKGKKSQVDLSASN